MGIVKFCSSGSEKLLPVIWYTHIRGVKLHLQYHQNQRVLGLVAASLRAFSGSCSRIGIHTVQHSETGGIVRSVRIRRRHLLSCDVKTIYLYWCHHSGGSAWRKSPLSSSLLWRFRQIYGNFGIFRGCDGNWERSVDGNVSMFRFCRVVGLSYVAVLGVDFVFQLCRILSEEIL